MADERLVLDPAEKIEGRTELDITPWVDGNGVDWGEAVQVPTRAEGERGELVVASKLENRLISAGCVLQDKGGTTFATIRSMLQAKVALYQREGGIVRRVTPQGGTVYADIVAAGLKLSGAWLQAHRNADNEAGFSLEAIPDFYEPEIELTSAEEKTATELIKVIPDPGGDMPARVRIEVTEKQGADQRSLIWAFRSRYYNSATTAKTAYEAEELQPLDTAVKVALSGASSGTVVQHGTVSTSWTPVLGLRLGGTAFLVHAGTNRIFARVYTTGGIGGTSNVKVRLVWDVGDLVNPEENGAVTLPTSPASTRFYDIDLGEVRLDKSPVGTHRWDGQVQSMGNEGKEDFKIDKVWIVNSDEGMGVLSAPLPPTPTPSLVTYSARSEFNTESGTITGDTLQVGGTWASLTGSDTTDFSVAEGVATRTAVSDTGTIASSAYSGRAIGVSLSLGNVAASVDLSTSAYVGGISQGLFFRVASASEFGYALLSHKPSGAPGARISVGRVIAGAVQGAGEEFLPWLDLLNARKMTIVCIGSYLRVYIDGQEVFGRALQVGGTVTGGVYIFDQNSSATAATRTYNNFAVWAPTADAVLFASQKAQITTQGMYRLDSGGSAYGPVSRVRGDLPRLPAGGLEGRSTELFLKASRGVLGETEDSAIDDLAAKVFASRSWLTVPGTI